ncbi:23S rRNA (uracil(1939)-C(5))-methyltransferase RlmD [uncultured Microscilla sp.]|uniref:23S rRNA (uracil(1939)-C(5))-methyltransferase RlmD n=1 Tax=uncultured Microscilla sp. TaxID=432653 RepID=UPI0026338C3D|nr:23S rRNA (uracil(1939)-C(5))-methyltransferase RlmD [uncultured Microscilla sp.]
MRRKKQVIIPNLTIEGVAAEGKCITRYEDKVIFVDGKLVAPQDVVDLKVTRKRKNYIEAIPVQFHEYSPLRIEPFCSHFGTCGGCKWQHLPYEQQLQFKQQQIIDNLERIGKLDLPEVKPILGSAHTQYYRNKLEFTFSNRRWMTKEEIATEEKIQDPNALGFHIPKRFDKILDIDHCYLQPDPSNKIRLTLKKYAVDNELTFFDQKNNEGFLRNVVIRNANSGDLMVIMIFFYDDQNLIVPLLEHLHSEVPEITSLQYIINPKQNDAYQDLPVKLFAGEPHITETMPSLDEGKPTLKFRVGAKSFYQTNASQAYELYKVAGEMADLKGNEVVYDLYTGTGTIANFIAHKAKKVIGLEYVPMAIENAKVNSEINSINNTSFFAGDIQHLLDEEFVELHGHPNVIITDPPRSGMHADVVDMLKKASPDKIVYVSCNPATQARDLAMLADEYDIIAVQPVDMFPHTHHVENVVLLERKVLATS